MTRSNITSDDRDKDGAPYAFFALVFILSLPFWWLGAVFDYELMPGLPLSSLMVVCPALAAFILRWRESGRGAAVVFLARAFDILRMRAPLFVAMLLLINPGLYATSYAIQTAIGVDLPAPDIRLGTTLILLAVFLIAAIAEELGWTGYALEPLQRRWGMVGTGAIIGLVAAAWHLAALGQVDRSTEWIAWWVLGTVAARVLIVWLYNHTGKSVFAIALYHAISNVCWQTYPVQGSYFDPRIDGLLTVALVIAVLWASAGSRREV